MSHFKYHVFFCCNQREAGETCCNNHGATDIRGYAKDRVKAWDEFMQKGTLPESRSCDHPIERNIRLGNALGINGTPTIIFEDGAITPGMLPAAEIERRLAGGGRPVGGAAQRVNAGKGD